MLTSNFALVVVELCECTANRSCYLLLSGFATEISRIIGIADKSYFCKNTRHSTLAKYPQPFLSYTSASASVVLILAFNELGYIDASIDIGLLHEVEDDIALSIRWVKTFISCFVITLKEHGLILTHSHIEVIALLVHADDVGLCTVSTATGRTIEVNADE